LCGFARAHVDGSDRLCLRCAKQVDQWSPAAVAALSRTAHCSLCFEKTTHPYVKLLSSSAHPRFYCDGCKKPTFPCGSCDEAMAADAGTLQVSACLCARGCALSPLP